MMSRIFFTLTNNILINNFLILFGLDKFVTSRMGIYKRVVLDETRSPRQMAGFTESPEINAALDQVHQQLFNSVQKYIAPGDAILDIGCGPGTYLKDFEQHYAVTGIDLNLQMINKAKEQLSRATFIHNDFLKNDFTRRFNFIYSISVLEFIPPGQLRPFFRKVYHLLEDEGVIFFLYPHALRLKDIFYPDLYYIEYSPRRIEESISNLFEIISHRHAFDDRQVDLYDKQPYQPGTRIFTNGYILVARKKTTANV